MDDFTVELDEINSNNESAAERKEIERLESVVFGGASKVMKDKKNTKKKNKRKLLVNSGDPVADHSLESDEISNSDEPESEKISKGNPKKKKISQEIERLESVIFGDVSKVVGEKKHSKKKKKQKLSSSSIESEELKKVPVWKDDDDDESIQAAFQAQGRPNITHPGESTDAYTSMLKRKFESIVGTPKWAEINRKMSDSDGSGDDENDDVGLLQRCGKLIEKSKTLDKGVINFKMVKNLNFTTECEGPVLKSVEFHPSSCIGLVAGRAGIASLFEVDGKVNAKLQSIQFTKFNIDCAKFTADGNRFIVGSKHHRHFFSHDLLAGKSIKVDVHKGTEVTCMQKFEISPDGNYIAACGRFGNIHLFSAKTYEWIDTLRMNGTVGSICFSSDGSKLFSFGDEGNVFIWDLVSRYCVHKFMDEGCLKGTCISVSPNNALLACGSSSGVVNVYNTKDAFTSKSPKPLKVFLNLTTSINCLKFNHSSQLLAMTSDKMEKSLKLAHFPSMTVYSNFPQNNNNNVSVGCIQSISFSPNSGYFGAASNNKKALLYRLNHFGSY